MASRAAKNLLCRSTEADQEAVPPAVRVLFLAAAVLFACAESDFFEAAECPSRFNALVVAADRLADVFVPPRAPFAESCCAFLRVACDVVPDLGGGNFTPARRAFDNPIAMACLVDRAPCLPSRI